MRKSLTRKERLRRRSDLNRVFVSVKKARCRGLKLLYIENNIQWNRIAFSTGKGFKRAVDRNRVKRVCREIYRTVKQQIKRGYDLIFIVYPGKYSFSERSSQVISLLEQAGLKY